MRTTLHILNRTILFGLCLVWSSFAQTTRKDTINLERTDTVYSLPPDIGTLIIENNKLKTEVYKTVTGDTIKVD